MKLPLLTLRQLLCVAFTVVWLLASPVVADNYVILISTGNGDTNDPVKVKLTGTLGSASAFRLGYPVGRLNTYFRRASTNMYKVRVADVGVVCSVELMLQGQDGWMVGMVSISNENSRRGQVFIFNREVDDWKSITESVAVNGGWSGWQAWGACPAKCGKEAVEKRFRVCSNPKPGCGGAYCRGEREQGRWCSGPACPTTTTPIPNTTTTVSTTTIYVTTREQRTTKRPVHRGVWKERYISLGFVLTLSILLSVILIVFLIIVRGHIREDRSLQCS